MFKPARGLVEEFGVERVRDTPISEEAIIGLAMGAAMLGMASHRGDHVLRLPRHLLGPGSHQVAKTRYMSNGQVSLPLVIRTANGGGLGFGGAALRRAMRTGRWRYLGSKLSHPPPRAIHWAARRRYSGSGSGDVFEHKALFPSKGEYQTGR